MSMRTFVWVLGAGLGGFLLYQWWHRQAASPGPGVRTDPVRLQLNTQAALNQIAADEYSAQNRRMNDQLIAQQGDLPGSL